MAVNTDNINVGESYLVLRRARGTAQPAVILDERMGRNSTSKEYYVHYENTDRRWDEWVDQSHIDPSPVTKQESNENSCGKKSSRFRKRKLSHHDSSPVRNCVFDVDATLEREHEEVTKVKYIEQISYGNFEIDTWYFSPYPDEYGKLKKLYICDFCMKYMKYESSLRAHLHGSCKERKPPGVEVYRENDLAVYEVYGNASEESKVYCQCLSLLSKLFLDHKTICYDLDSFIFYVLCEITSLGSQMVGYFSKEKDSPEGNNLACICILPPFQRHGYGQLLIQLSYELSKREKVVGSPEKPLSDLGRISYQSFWTWKVLSALEKCNQVTLEDLSKVTGISTVDIVETLRSLNLTKYWKGQPWLRIPKPLLDQYRKNGVVRKPRLQLKSRLLKWPSKGK
ncbi:hypothetical protein AB6A40_008051 [Gnathostoma spinigerum]|uniref:Histone acetyltransferase n=1 Tax=Gnathostoma spinigerum TaxID=75299 RepID=A0ABD6EQA1_9BILA